MEFDDFDQQEQIYEYKSIPITKRLKGLFRLIDFYALPVTLRHKGQKMFYTNFGALTSFFIIIIMCIITVFQLNIVF